MHRPFFRFGRTTSVLLRGTMAGAVLIASVANAAEEFQPESLKDGVSLPAGMTRLYVSDFAIGHLMDGRIYVLDGKSGSYAGGLDAGFAGQFTLSPDGSEAYVATTYLSRHSHGERSDVVEIYDTATLRLKGDVELPKKRAQALFYKGLLRTSSDGRYLFVQNATPATSVTVVNLAERKVVTEVPSPGCWALYPSKSVPLRFSMLCGDGKLATVTLAADGKVEKRSTSVKFFDSDKDPVFIAAAQDGDTYYFISFNGNLTRTNLGGNTAVIDKAVSIVNNADQKKGWRPGGYQVQALHRSTGTLYIAMHPNGKEGSHKMPATEVWGISTSDGKRVTRIPVSNATVLSISNNEPGYLYAMDGLKNQIHAYELGNRMRAAFVSAPLGEAPVQMEAP